MSDKKVPVSMRAVHQRINRRLATQAAVLKKARTRYIRADLGQYYVVNLGSNLVKQRHVDPVALAKELGVLAEWETVREEE